MSRKYTLMIADAIMELLIAKSRYNIMYLITYYDGFRADRGLSSLRGFTVQKVNLL